MQIFSSHTVGLKWNCKRKFASKSKASKLRNQYVLIKHYRLNFPTHIIKRPIRIITNHIFQNKSCFIKSKKYPI